MAAQENSFSSNSYADHYFEISKVGVYDSFDCSQKTFYCLFSVVASLCEGTCNVVNHITKGLCHTLDVAVAFLKVTEVATRWVGKAINFLLTAFRVKR